MKKLNKFNLVETKTSITTATLIRFYVSGEALRKTLQCDGGFFLFDKPCRYLHNVSYFCYFIDNNEIKPFL